MEIPSILQKITSVRKKLVLLASMVVTVSGVTPDIQLPRHSEIAESLLEHTVRHSFPCSLFLHARYSQPSIALQNGKRATLTPTGRA